MKKSMAGRLGHWAFVLAALTSARPTSAANVATVSELREAVIHAMPGDVITVMPGYYALPRTAATQAGTAERPITVRAERLGSVLIRAVDVEGFAVQAPYWTFENLAMSGEPYSEHAFHIVGGAGHTQIRNNLLFNFDAMIKGNGLPIGQNNTNVFPDDVVIEDNMMLNTALRSGNAPVAPVDVVGGHRWIVRHNFIADFSSESDRRVSYGAFLKGNAKDGIIERNLVICEWHVPGGPARVGLSLGGGGTTEGMCQDNDCKTESRSGTLRNNIVMNCRGDIGVYINKGADSKITNNTFYDTYGIDVRFPVSSAAISGNVLAGGARTRDGASLTLGENMEHGNKAGLKIHQGFVFLADKLEGANKKYPSIFRTSLTDWLRSPQGPLHFLDTTLANSLFGRGGSAGRALFADPEALDFKVKGAMPTHAGDGGEGLDYCGHPRDKSNTAFGAIEYSAGGCDVGAMARKAEEILKILPRAPAP